MKCRDGQRSTRGVDIPWTTPVLMMDPILEWVWFTIPEFTVKEGGKVVERENPVPQRKEGERLTQ